MSRENIKCKQNFKPIEGFLRRVAYNLGNTPSQTEVKIISCIPVDVTDLQQKILQLEKELEEAKQKSPTKSSVVQTKRRQPSCTACNVTYEDTKGASCNPPFVRNSSLTLHCTDVSSKFRKSNSTIICQDCQPISNTYSCEHNSNVTDTKNCFKGNERYKNLFTKKTNLSKKKYTTQAVYYAQTCDRTPFNSYNVSEDVTSKNADKHAVKSTENSLSLSRTYLAEIVEKQYKSQPGMTVFGNLSDFSTPVCRDNVTTCSRYCHDESDMCSCCHGRCHNIDDHMNNRNDFDILPKCAPSQNYHRNTYYDSNLYDLVPVREKPAKFRNDIEMPKRKRLKKQAIAKCSPEIARSRRRVPLVILNCHTVSQVGQYRAKGALRAQNRKEMVLNNMATRRINKIIQPRPFRDIGSSKICNIDLGPIYAKRLEKDNKSKNSPSTDTEGKTDPLISIDTTKDNTKNQTVNVPEVRPPVDKTEITLNQIKVILQSVLNEVKTKSKLGKPIEPTKKDAVVQNGLSQSNVYGTSELMQSFTYSPYSMKHYLPSYSRQMFSNYTYPDMASGLGNCVQHYPLLIQSPQKHVCTNCYRHTNNTKSVNTNWGASAATNTEKIQGRSKETENLIKEIYKSMALHVELPSNDTATEYKDIERFERDPEVKIGSKKENKQTANIISEIFRNTNQQESSDTPITDTTIASKPNSMEACVGSKRIMTNCPRIETTTSSNGTNSVMETNDKNVKREHISHDLESEDESDATVSKEVTEQSTSETESDDVVVEIEEPLKTKKKTSLFNRIIKIFKPRIKKETVLKQVAKESDSDSDDYQTVYSQPAVTPKKKIINVRSRPHSKVFYSKQVQQRRSRTRSPDKLHRIPYMEQEQRRYWAEKLMFQEHQDKRSTEISRNTTLQNRRPVYYQNYETRNTLIEPSRDLPTMVPYGLRNNYAENLPTKDNCAGSKAYSRNRPNHPGIHINYRNNAIRNNCNVKPHFMTSSGNGQQMMSPKGVAWLKKHKLGIRCGERWK